MDQKFKLRVEDVLNKNFNVDFKGYASSEVDEFLDLVIEDYQQYNETIQELGEHLLAYEREVATLRSKIVELEGKNSIQSEHNPSSNLDIIKRLSRLEEAIFHNIQSNQ